MAVQARRLPHGFPIPAAAGGASLLFAGDHAARVPVAGLLEAEATLLADFPRSDLTSSCDYGFAPRKRARVAAAAAAENLLEDQRQRIVPVQLASVPAVDVRSGDVSTSGRVGMMMVTGAAVSHSQSQGLLSTLYHQGVEIDELVRLESERMRAGLEEARRRHARALLAAVARAAAGRLWAAEADLERALRSNADLEEKARQAGAECQAWAGVARSHEAVAAGLRATLDQLLQSPLAVAAFAAGEGEGEAEDARSCCFEAPADDGAASGCQAAPRCKSCWGGQASVLLLPCRHLCLCADCEAFTDACPVCAAAKNGSLHVLVC